MGNCINKSASKPEPAEHYLVPCKLQDIIGCASFSESMAVNMDGKKRHPKAQYYFKDFRAKRTELARDLYSYFNATVFENMLPADLEIKFSFQQWYTAGLTLNSIYKGDDRYAIIFLSIANLRKPQDVRDTLLHEMCHAAAWIVDGIPGKVAGHGPAWLKWTTLAESIHPDIKIEEIFPHKDPPDYLYKCGTCDNDIGIEYTLPEILRTCHKCGGTLKMVDIHDPHLKKTIHRMMMRMRDLRFK